MTTLPDQTHVITGVGRRNESCRHKWLLLDALNGHSQIFTLQIFCLCRHMWRCGDHLLISVLLLVSQLQLSRNWHSRRTTLERQGSNGRT